MEQQQIKRFTTFRGGDHLNVLQRTPEPIVYFLVEDKPSNFYCKVGYIIESRLTGEWFSFNKHSYALEGDSGHRDLKEFMAELREGNVPFSAWVIPQALLDAMERGEVLWQSARQQIVPLDAFDSEDDGWPTRKNNMARARQ